MYLPEYRNKWDKALKSYSLLESVDQVMQLFKIHSFYFNYFCLNCGD